MEQKTTQLTVINEDVGLSDDSRIAATLHDDGDGEYVRLSQPDGDGEITVTTEQWAILRDSVDQLLGDSE